MDMSAKNGVLLQDSSTGELLTLSRRILAELRQRKVIRTGNDSGRRLR
jgi:hypothetical protein